MGRRDVKKADLTSDPAPALSHPYGKYMKTLIATLFILVAHAVAQPCAADPVQFPSRFYSNSAISWSGADPAVYIDIPASQLDYRIPTKPGFVFRGIFAVGVTASGARSSSLLVGPVSAGPGETLRPIAMAFVPHDYHFYSTAVPVCVIVQTLEQPTGGGEFTRLLWESPCVPIDTSVPTSCTLTNSVLLDHGVVTVGNSSGLTSAALNINCNAAATGRLSLASANDRISLGVGYSTIKTSTGPLKARLSLSKGANTVVLTSELTGVGAGSWSGSGTLSLNLD